MKHEKDSVEIEQSMKRKAVAWHARMFRNLRGEYPTPNLIFSASKRRAAATVGFQTSDESSGNAVSDCPDDRILPDNLIPSTRILRFCCGSLHSASVALNLRDRKCL